MRVLVSFILFILLAYFGVSIGQSHHAWKWYAGVVSVILFLMINAGKQTAADEKQPLPFYAHLIFWVLEALDGLVFGIFIGTFR